MLLCICTVGMYGWLYGMSVAMNKIGSSISSILLFFLAGDSALLEDVQKRSYVLQWKHGKPENIEPGTFF